MRLAVADEDAAVFVDEDAVEACHFALERVAVGSVAFFAGAGDEFEVAGFGVDHSDGMAFGVGEEDVSVGVDGDAFGAFEGGGAGGASVAGEAAGAGAGDVVDGLGGEVEAEDLVAFARGEPEVAFGIEIEGARSFEGSAFERRAVGGGSGLSGAGESADGAGFHVYGADDVVADVADEEVAVGSELDAVGLFELGGCGGAFVAGVAGFSGAGDGGDDVGFPVDFANGVVGHIDNEEVAVSVEPDFVWKVEGGFGGGATVAGVAFLSGARDGADGAIGCDAADALSGVFAEPDGAVGSANDAEGVVDGCAGCGAAIAGEALFTRAGEGFDGPCGGVDRGERERGEEGEEGTYGTHGTDGFGGRHHLGGDGA